MSIMVPKKQVDEYTKPRQTVFPEGQWLLALEETRERGFPDFISDNVAAGRNSGYSTGDGEILGLQFGNARSLDTPGERTNQKHFIDLVTRDGNHTIEDHPSTIPGSSWQLTNSATMLAMIATALGATEEVSDDEGTVYVTIADGFLDELRAGAYTNAELGVETWHRKWTSKAGKSGTEVNTRKVFAAT